MLNFPLPSIITSNFYLPMEVYFKCFYCLHRWNDTTSFSKLFLFSTYKTRYKLVKKICYIFYKATECVTQQHFSANALKGFAVIYFYLALSFCWDCAVRWAWWFLYTPKYHSSSCFVLYNLFCSCSVWKRKKNTILSALNLLYNTFNVRRVSSLVIGWGKCL